MRQKLMLVPTVQCVPVRNLLVPTTSRLLTAPRRCLRARCSVSQRLQSAKKHKRRLVCRHCQPPPLVLSHRPRSEEHTSELQSRGHLVCRLLLEKTHQPVILSKSTDYNKWQTGH